MIKHVKIITIATLLLVVVALPQHSHAQTLATSALSDAQKLELIQSLLTQIATLQALLDAKQSDDMGDVEEGVENVAQVEKPRTTLGYDGPYRQKYSIRRGELVSRSNHFVKDNPEDEMLWDLFVKLAGQEFVETYIREFWIFDSEESSSRAYVRPMWVSFPRWIFAFNVHDIDLENEEDVHEVINTFIHEIAHISALNRLQADHNEEEVVCDTYFVGDYACLDKDSYQYQFIQAFWSDADLAYAVESEDMEAYDEKLEFVTKHYDRDPDAFVSVYAASDPVEDFAETFLSYTITSYPYQLDAASDKVHFLNRSSQLRTLRDDLRRARSAYLAEYYAGQ